MTSLLVFHQQVLVDSTSFGPHMFGVGRKKKTLTKSNDTNKVGMHGSVSCVYTV